MEKIQSRIVGPNMELNKDVERIGVLNVQIEALKGVDDVNQWVRLSVEAVRIPGDGNRMSFSGVTRVHLAGTDRPSGLMVNGQYDLDARQGVIEIDIEPLEAGEVCEVVHFQLPNGDIDRYVERKTWSDAKTWRDVYEKHTPDNPGVTISDLGSGTKLLASTLWFNEKGQVNARTMRNFGQENSRFVVPRTEEEMKYDRVKDRIRREMKEFKDVTCSGGVMIKPGDVMVWYFITDNSLSQGDAVKIEANCIGRLGDTGEALFDIVMTSSNGEVMFHKCVIYNLENGGFGIRAFDRPRGDEMDLYPESFGRREIMAYFREAIMVGKWPTWCARVRKEVMRN